MKGSVLVPARRNFEFIGTATPPRVSDAVGTNGRLTPRGFRLSCGHIIEVSIAPTIGDYILCIRCNSGVYYLGGTICPEEQ